MKKKIIALCLAVALLAVAAISGTLAYFMDTDDAVNVFTLGNVKIELHEDNGELKDSEKPTYTDDKAYETWLAGQELFPTIKIEKDAWVKNSGNNDAYVRMFILYPKAVANMIEIAYDDAVTGANDTATEWHGAKLLSGADAGLITKTIDGVEYVGYCYTRKTALAAGAVTSDVITSVTLKTDVECEVLDNGDTIYSLGSETYITKKGSEEFLVRVYVEAGQTKVGDANAENWKNPDYALNTMFGEPAEFVYEESGKTHLASSQEEFEKAIKAAEAGDTVLLSEEGTYTLPADFASTKDITVSGVGDVTVLDIADKTYGANSADITFKNMKIVCGNNDYQGFHSSSNETYINCTFVDEFRAYATNATFTNCVFTQTNGSEYNIWTYGSTNVTFNDCEFECAGKAVLIYNEGTVQNSVVTFNNCKFKASKPASDGKAAIEIDSRFSSYTVYINNCTSEGFDAGSVSGNTLWNNKKGNKLTAVYVNDVAQTLNTAPES